MDSSAFFDTLVTTIALIAPQLSKEERETTANEMFGQVMQLTSPKVHRLNEFWWSASSSRPTAIFFNWRP
jgi:hypothetical protein